jgi:hypothetical protein
MDRYLRFSKMAIRFTSKDVKSWVSSRVSVSGSSPSSYLAFASSLPTAEAALNKPMTNPFFVPQEDTYLAYYDQNKTWKKIHAPHTKHTLFGFTAP